MEKRGNYRLTCFQRFLQFYVEMGVFTHLAILGIQLGYWQRLIGWNGSWYKKRGGFSIDDEIAVFRQYFTHEF